MLIRSPLIISSLILGSIFIHIDSCFGMEGETQKFSQILRRKQSFRQSLQIFKSMLPSSPPKDSVNGKKKLAPKDFDEWPSSEEEEEEDEDNPRFSVGAKSRAQSMRKKIEKGHSPEILQRTSQDWYTRNRVLCVDADGLLQKGMVKTAQSFIEQASQNEFPGATFELAKLALDGKQLHKAKLYFRKTCEQLRDKGHLLDNQYRDQQLVKGILVFAKRDVGFEEVLKDFQDLSYFQTQQGRTEKPMASALNPLLLKYAEDDEEDPLFNEFVDKLFKKKNEVKEPAPEEEDELFFDEE